MKIPLRSEAGLTLIELMFAAGVMALGLSFLFGSLVSVSLAGELSSTRAIAVTHLATVMEEVSALSRDGLPLYQPPAFGDLGPQEAVTVRVYGSTGGAITLPVDPATLAQPLPNPTRVECVVTWTTMQGRILSQTASALFYKM